ncbi:thioredoxin-like protein 4A isoform c [Mus musculus]|uniref:thioredoxin-like protein 4A isoform c n=1 Tax=Mus musculus TaxID=10090 RepID=UPI00155B188A|nr:thioredoxin-like protein 4A isoform c [Mus musculus]
MSYMLPHLHNGWQVDQAILSEEDRVVVIRFGHDWDPTCMKMDEVLYSIAEKPPPPLWERRKPDSLCRPEGPCTFFPSPCLLPSPGMSLKLFKWKIVGDLPHLV